MASGGRSTSEGSGQTGPVTSLSFVPALLSHAFMGSGIGINDGGFQILGNRDYNPGGRARGGISPLIDPTSLASIIGSNNLLGRGNPFSDFWSGEGGTNAAGGGGGGFGGYLESLLAPQDLAGGPLGGGILPALAGTGNWTPVGGMAGIVNDLFGQDPMSAEDIARMRTNRLQGFSPGALGLGTGGIFSPYDLISNIMDMTDPNINPGLAGGLAGIAGGSLGQIAGNNLLMNSVAPTFQEGLATGFKPDLQPVIDEATRRFFQDTVPQLGQSNVAMMEGVGPFSTDLQRNLLTAGTDLQSGLGALETQLQSDAANRRSDLLSLSGLISDQIFNASTNAGRNLMDLGEQFALQGTRGGRQATMLQLLAGMQPAGPIQSSSSSNQSKSGQGGILA